MISGCDYFGKNKRQSLLRRIRNGGDMVLGALEAGGTKMVCAIGNENGEIKEQISIPTQTPEITVPKLLRSEEHTSELQSPR